MAVGNLVFYANNTYEFKTSGSLNLADFRKDYKNNDEYQNDVANKKHYKEIVNLQNSKNKISSLLKGNEDPNEYEHLSNFLKA